MHWFQTSTSQIDNCNAFSWAFRMIHVPRETCELIKYHNGYSSWPVRCKQLPCASKNKSNYVCFSFFLSMHRFQFTPGYSRVLIRLVDWAQMAICHRKFSKDLNRFNQNSCVTFRNIRSERTLIFHSLCFRTTEGILSQLHQMLCKTIDATIADISGDNSVHFRQKMTTKFKK